MNLFLCLLLISSSFLGVASVTSVTDDELQSFMDELFIADIAGNRAGENQVQVNEQARTNLGSKDDKAPKPYFEYVDESILEIPTYKHLIELYDDYNPMTGVEDRVTSEKQQDIDNFVNAIASTQVFKMMQSFLADNGLTEAKNDAKFRDLLDKIWFSPYSRARGKADTSAFEHVFLGEYKKGEMHGLHSWVRVYWLEKENKLNYNGHLFKNQQLAQIQFKVDNYLKKGGSFLLRASPEFDLSMFTLCFLAKPGSKACKFTLFDCTPVMVTTYANNQNGLKYLGTAYPQSARKDRTCKPKPLPIAPKKPSMPDPNVPDTDDTDDFPALPHRPDPRPEPTPVTPAPEWPKIKPTPKPEEPEQWPTLAPAKNPKWTPRPYKPADVGGSKNDGKNSRDYSRTNSAWSLIPQCIVFAACTTMATFFRL